MELNLNSLTAKLYRWFYKQNEMPSSLCPYFWKMILACILYIPLFLFDLPSRIARKIQKENTTWI